MCVFECSVLVGLWHPGTQAETEAPFLVLDQPKGESKDAGGVSGPTELLPQASFHTLPRPLTAPRISHLSHSPVGPRVIRCIPVAQPRPGDHLGDHPTLETDSCVCCRPEQE